MLDESLEIPRTDQNLENKQTKSLEKKNINYEKIPFPKTGRFVRSFLEKHPEINLTEDL